MEHATLFQVTIAPKWSQYMVDYITTRIFPEDISKARQKAIELESRDYAIIGEQLYKRGKDNQLRLCATESEYLPLLEQAHAGISRGHFAGDKTAKIVLSAGIWWPTLHMDADEYVKRCNDCQRTKVPIKRDDMPLRPLMGARAFAKWGLDFVGQ